MTVVTKLGDIVIKILDTVGKVFKRLELPFNFAIYSGDIKRKYV